MARIALDNVEKRYATEVALRGVTLTFADDVTTAIVGKSGSGKSTLLQLVNGLVRPTSGRVTVFDRPIDYARLPALRRDIGYAVQGTGLFPHLTVVDNIALLARMEKWAWERTRDRVEELMRLVELPAEYATRYPHELSGGQQQRVGLCRAMMLDPPIFLLDEPFGALDAMTRSEIHAEFARLQRAKPRTIVLVTHDIREALALAERIVVMDDGVVLQHDTAAEVLAHPADARVAGMFAGAGTDER